MSTTHMRSGYTEMPEQSYQLPTGRHITAERIRRTPKEDQ